MTEPYYMLNSEYHQRRIKIAALIGNAVKANNEDYNAYKLGLKVIEELENNNYEVVWLGTK